MQAPIPPQAREHPPRNTTSPRTQSPNWTKRRRASSSDARRPRRSPAVPRAIAGRRSSVGRRRRNPSVSQGCWKNWAFDYIGFDSGTIRVNHFFMYFRRSSPSYSVSYLQTFCSSYSVPFFSKHWLQLSSILSSLRSFVLSRWYKKKIFLFSRSSFLSLSHYRIFQDAIRFISAFVNSLIFSVKRSKGTQIRCSFALLKASLISLMEVDPEINLKQNSQSISFLVVFSTLSSISLSSPPLMLKVSPVCFSTFARGTLQCSSVFSLSQVSLLVNSKALQQAFSLVLHLMILYSFQGIGMPFSFSTISFYVLALVISIGSVDPLRYMGPLMTSTDSHLGPRASFRAYRSKAAQIPPLLYPF